MMGREVVSQDLERWLKERRDGITNDDSRWGQVDDLLGEVRDAGAVGLLPWEVTE